MKIYNMGIIGFGGMGEHHYDQSKKMDRVNVIGMYDINSKRCTYAESLGLKAYASADEMLADPDIDIVLVSTPNDTHKKYVIKALKADKNVICEKPAAISSKDFLEMMQAAESSKGVFTIDQNRRVNKDFVLMRRQVESGVIGEPYVIESRVEGSRGMPEGWRTLKKYGGGMMLDWGVHLIDQIMYMYSDQKVVNVFCKMFSINYPEIDDNFRLTMTFENGVVAHIEVSTNTFIQHPRWFVLGKKGTLKIDSWDCKGKIVREITKDDNWDTKIKKVKAGPSKTMAPRNPDTYEIRDLWPPEDVVDNIRPVYEQFINAIDGTGELTINPQQVLRVIKVMEAAFESDKNSTAVNTDI